MNFHATIKSIAFCALLIPSTGVIASDDSDFPSACEIDESGAVEPGLTHQEKFERFSLGTLQSMAAECAFGDRIQGMIDGAMSAIFDKLSEALDFDDENFFCGFGTRDVWVEATAGTGLEGSHSFNSWRNRELSDARNEIDNYQRDWRSSSDRDDSEGDERNVFDMIFNPSESEPEDSDGGWF